MNVIWTIKKAEHQRTDTFELWCWRRLLRVPWTARRSNQSILKEINPEYSLEGLMLMMKLQYFGHLIWRTGSLETALMLGKIEGRRRREWQKMRWLDSVNNSMEMSLSKFWEIVKDREDMYAAVHGVTKSLTWLSDWRTTKEWQGQLWEAVGLNESCLKYCMDRRWGFSLSQGPASGIRRAPLGKAVWVHLLHWNH